MGRRTLAAVMASVAILCGATACSTVTDPGAPQSSFDPQQDIKDLTQAFGTATSISEYYKVPEANTPDGKARRDAFITGRLTLINLEYIQFVRNFAVDTAQLDAAFDITKLGVDLATTLAPGAATKSILGAIAGGLTGSRISIDKNFLQQKTVPVLVSEMNAQRKVALVPILSGLTKDVSSYPLTMALVDLQTYYEAGTFVGALQTIQKDAAVKEGDADARIQMLRSTVFAADASTQRIKADLWPSGTGQPADQGNLTKLRQWMSANLPDGVPIATFLNAPTEATDRAKALTDLAIP